MIQLTVYVDPPDIRKIKRKKGEYGMISLSSYLRHLIDIDIGKVKPPVQF